jgi:hypothetical protein
MTPYYVDGTVTIWHGDARSAAAIDDGDVLITDPPYGIAYHSGWQRLAGNARSIAGDADTSIRDLMLTAWGSKPALVFGTWKRPTPAATKAMLVWDQGGALGMGDLSIPWKPSWQAIYVLGGPWPGGRDRGAVLRYPPVQSVGRHHPHQKPVELMAALIDKCPPGTIVDPFMGSGSTLVAAKSCGRRAVGVELDERYCEIAAKRCAQGVLWEAS